MEVGVIIVIIIVGLVLNFIPTIIAFNRNHHNKVGVFLVNFFFGWTLLGWVAALIWSLSKPPQVQVVQAAPPAMQNRSTSGEEVRPFRAKPVDSAPSTNAPINPAFEAKWETLVKYDDDIGSAVKKLESYGPPAIEKFKQIYSALEDKSKIDRIVADITEEIDKTTEQRAQLAAARAPEIEKLKEQGYEVDLDQNGDLVVLYKGHRIRKTSDDTFFVYDRQFNNINIACEYIDHYKT